MSDWQPIETAPRDGTEVLLFVKNTGVTSARFCPGEWTDHHEYGREYDGAVWSCCDDTWQIEVEEPPVEANESPYLDGNATHWMPLPEPPVQS